MSVGDSPTDLQREFGEPADHEGLDDRWERALIRLAGKRQTWTQLKAHTTVILGEGGTGKSTELRARVAAINAGGGTAFFIPVVDIVGRELRRALGVEVERLDRWLAGDQEAWFFLDGLDEGRLAGASVRVLLRDLESQISPGLRRTRVVLSCRPSEWEPATDVVTLTENALSWKPDAALALETLVMLPLDLDRSMRLARHLGVQDLDAFSEAIDAAGLELFLERPLDVEWFVLMWNETRRFGPLSEMIQENIRAKLADRIRVPAARRISIDQARSGVRRLAAVATLSGQRAFPVRAGAQRAAGGFRVADILHEWSGEDVDCLLSLPIFDEAIGGMVRLHTREVQEFLCAEWISEEVKRGTLSVDGQLSSLFIVQRGSQRVVPPHLVRVAAWLAAQHPRVLDLLIECAPQQLLDEGDPAALPIDGRERVLRAFAEQYKERNRIDIRFEPRGLRRFADPGLGATIADLLASSPSEDVRVLLLKLIGFGELHDLAEVALRIALDQQDSVSVRYAAVEAAALAGTAEHRQALHAIVDEKDIDQEIAAQLIEHLFPSVVTVPDLRRMMVAFTARDHGSTHTRLDSVLWEYLPRLCPPHAQQEVIEILVDAHAVTAGAWLVHPIAKMVATTVNARPEQLDHDQTRRALAILSDQGSSTDTKAILDVARENERVRHRLVWWQIEQLRATGDTFSAWQLRGSDLIGSVLGLEDFQWLELDASNRGDDEVATAARQVREAMETPYVPPAPVEEPVFDTATRGEIEGHLDKLRSGHAQLLEFCIDPFEKAGSGWGTIDVPAMTRELAPGVVEAIRTGLSRFWRIADVVAPRDWSHQNTPMTAVLGLKALAWELADQAAVGMLSAEESARATTYALWELNEFPDWLQVLRTFHAATIDEQVALQAVHELRSGDTRERVIMKVFGSSDPLRRAVVDRIEETLLNEEIRWSPAFQSAASLLAGADANHVGRWKAVLDGRMSSAVHDDQFASYWMLELRADRGAAIGRLERLVAGTDREVERVDAIIERIWNRIDDESGPFPYSNDATFLERLYVVLLNPRLPTSENVFAGRARLRSVVERWVSKLEEGPSILARMAARDETPFRERREHLLRLADQSSLSIAPMSRTDAVMWTRACESGDLRGAQDEQGGVSTLIADIQVQTRSLTDGESPSFKEPYPWLTPEPTDFKTDSTWFRARHGVDVLLVTATPIEQKAVLRRMGPPLGESRLVKVPHGQNTYFVGSLGEASVALVMSRMGPGMRDGSGPTVAEAIDHCRPRAVIAVGISWGMKTTKLKIGDVLVSSRVIPFDSMRRESGGGKSRAAQPEAGGVLLNRFRNETAPRFTRPDGYVCKVYDGPLLSGQSLVDDLEFKAELHQRFHDAIGGEMEGEGVYGSTAKHKGEWIIVKAVCDWGDGKKNDDYQTLAAASAVSLVVQIVESPGALHSLKNMGPEASSSSWPRPRAIAIVIGLFVVTLFAVLAVSLRGYFASSVPASLPPGLAQRAWLSVDAQFSTPALVAKDDNAQINLTLMLRNTGAAAATNVEIYARAYRQEFGQAIFKEPLVRQRDLCDPIAKERKPRSESSRMTIAPSSQAVEYVGVGVPNVAGAMMPIVVGCVNYFVAPNEHHQTRFIYQVQLLREGEKAPSLLDLSKVKPNDTLQLDKYYFGGWDAD